MSPENCGVIALNDEHSKDLVGIVVYRTKNTYFYALFDTFEASCLTHLLNTV